MRTPRRITQYMANCFMEDLASRLVHRVQISSDALSQYEGAIERAFGAEVDYGSIIKTFSHSDLAEQRRYSPPEVISVKRVPVAGAPVVDLISTSYVEKQNHTLRMHCRRLSRLTIEMLMRAFVQAYDVEVAYVESVPVKDTFQGQTAWEGIVDVFDLKGHPDVVRGYGWPYDIKDGEIQYATVLAKQPINSPVAAVRAFIHSQANDQP